MGSAADPWRVAQARHRNRADECGQVYGQAARPAVPRMEDIPPQSRRRHRRDGSVRRADNLVSSALWTADRGARPTTDRMARRHTAHPTAEWVANQITEAFGWERAPHYRTRDPD